ncbi:MAG: hypothetical protein ABIS69_05060 [Sediminibacterium sp.]
MKALLLIPLISIFLIADLSAQNDPASPVKSKVFYSGSGKSSIEIMVLDSNQSNAYTTVETSYKIVNIAIQAKREPHHYLAEYTTTTKSCTGCEGQQRRIHVELKDLDKPQKTLYTIDQNGDELMLENHNYRTVTHGCCGAEDYLAIYDYDNKLIIDGDARILFGDIPNTQFGFYVSYKPEYEREGILGTLYFSYNSDERYAISIQSTPLPDDICSPVVPEIRIETGNSKDEFFPDTNEYLLWSQEQVKSKSEINHLNLKISYLCEPSLQLDPITIPIMEGKPFGKPDRIQSIQYVHP